MRERCGMRMGWLVVTAAALAVGMGCVEPAPGSGGKSGSTGRGKAFAFQWKAGTVGVEETVERDGEVLTIAWQATVKPDGGRLRIAFSGGELVDGLKEALGPRGSHPFYQVMPELVVDARDGRLVAVEKTESALKESGKLGITSRSDERSLSAVATKEGVEERARERWAQWSRLIGFDQALGTNNEHKSELQLEDGLKMPVVTTTSHEAADTLSAVKIVRAFSGAAVARIYKQVLASTGAPDAMVEAVEKVVREEHYEATVDPKTLMARQIRSRELTTVHSRGGKVELKAASETWVFAW